VGKKREGENRIVNIHTTRFTYHELGLPLRPQRRGVPQVGKNIVYCGPFVAVLQPAQLNGPPQVVTEPKACCLLWFLRSDPLNNLGENDKIRVEFDVGVVSA